MLQFLAYFSKTKLHALCTKFLGDEQIKDPDLTIYIIQIVFVHHLNNVIYTYPNELHTDDHIYIYMYKLMYVVLNKSLCKGIKLVASLRPLNLNFIQRLIFF